MKRGLFLLILFLLTTFVSVEAKDHQMNLLDKLSEMNDLEKVRYLGELCWELNEKSNDDAVNYGQLALDLALKNNFYSEAAKISNYLGVAMLYYQYDKKNAWLNFRGALDYSIEAKDSVQMAYAYDNIGYMYYLHNNYSNALQNVTLALQIFQSLDDNRGQAYVHSSLGIILSQQASYPEAIEHFNLSLQEHLTENNLDGAAAVHSNYGKTYILMNDYKNAQIHFEKTIEIADQANHSKYLASGLTGLAEVMATRQEFDTADSLFNKALKLNLEKNDKYGILETRIKKGLIYAKNEQFQKGKEQLNMAFETAEEIGVPQKIYDVYKAYSEFYHISNSFENVAGIYEELFSAYNKMNTDYEMEKLLNEEQRIEIAQNLENTKNELKLEKRERLYFYAFLLLSLLVAAILFWKYYSVRKLSKKLSVVNSELSDVILKKNDAYSALKKSQQELQVSNQTKSKFFSIIAHDLKGPFNSILGFSEMLEKDYDHLVDSQRRSYISLLNQSSKQVYNLLENLLAWAAAQTHKLELNPELVNVGDAIERNIQIFKNLAIKKDISIRTEIEKDLFLKVDINMFNLLVRNLISNALKFTSTGGNIEISGNIIVIDTGKVFEFNIKDNGIGIPQNELDALFNFNVNNSTMGTENEKGTGLGLMLCSEITKLHGGLISATSEPNKGSCFTFTLPV